MSSGVADGFILRPKLLLHIAENGNSFEVECDGTTSVDSIMRFVQSVSGIDLNDQLALCSEMKLEPQRPLSAFKLPSDDREVFIFNKSRLQSNSPPPAFEQINILEVVDPPPASSSHKPHPLDDASDPALKALPSYERQFRYHYHCGNSIYSRSQLRYETCQRLYGEQKVQERALEVARANLEQYHRVINQNFTEFMKRYLLQRRLHADLLANFRRDIERLRSIKLHPALQTSIHKCLLDLVKEENLHKAAEICANSHRQFENKVSQFKQMFGEAKGRVEDVLASKTSLAGRNLEIILREHQRYINEQRSIMQSLSKDVDTVKKLVDDGLSGNLSSSLRPHDAVSALGPMYDVHDKNHLPRMRACDRAMCKLLEFFKDKKNEMNIFVHNYMQWVTYVTYSIKDARLQFPAFKEAMVRQDDLFMELKLVRGIGPAYRSCLAEVVRRKASMKLYMGLAGQLAERLATKREAEVTRREEFLKEQSSFIPGEILAAMGLYDTPSQCDVNIAPFDNNLLNIDIQDLDLYAPDYLEKQGSFKGSLTITSNSHGSVESAQDGLREDCELVEIVGTSKMEVENAKLKADYASAVAVLCSISHLVDYESLDDSKVKSALKDAAEKTSEALNLKDEYSKHLSNMLKSKQIKCISYEKRLHELEHKLSQACLQDQKPMSLSCVDAAESPLTKLDCKLDDRSGNGEIHMPCYPTEPMDEVSCVSDSLDRKSDQHNRQPDEPQGRLGNMMNSATSEHPLNALFPEQHPLEPCVNYDKEEDHKMMGQSGMSRSSSARSINEQIVVACATIADTIGGSQNNDALVLKLQNALSEKSSQLKETEVKLQVAMEEIDLLRKELEVKQKLLGESQMNCAHLENCLHEAREEAQTHLCAANRRASEYSTLRASAVKMCSLFERLRACVYSSGGVGFADSLLALAQSLHRSMGEKEDDGSAELHKCVQILADRVAFLSRHREELLDKCLKLEAANDQLRMELEEKKEMVKALYKKNQLEKQAKKDKISFGHLEVHEIAAFVVNSRGQYVAINRNSSNYYLSVESVALFTDHHQSRPSYIIGQIVHVERRVMESSSTSVTTNCQKKEETSLNKEIEKLAVGVGFPPSLGDLPVGFEYFVVTVAMLPGITTGSPTHAS